MKIRTSSIYIHIYINRVNTIKQKTKKKKTVNTLLDCIGLSTQEKYGQKIENINFSEQGNGNRIKRKVGPTIIKIKFRTLI